MFSFFPCYCVHFTSFLCSATTGALMLASLASLVFTRWHHIYFFLVHYLTSVCTQMVPLHFAAYANGHRQSIIYTHVFPALFWHSSLCSDDTEQLFLHRCFSRNNVKLANGEVQFCLVGFSLFSCMLHSWCFYAIIPKWERAPLNSTKATTTLVV